MSNDQYLLKALDFIDNNITEDINLYDISCEAGFSVPHFYRLFKRLTGDTVGAYIIRRRVSLAARDLLGSNKSISSIGMECKARLWDCDGMIGRLWSDFLMRAEEITKVSDPVIMYGICEHELCDNEQFNYMASIGVDEAAEAPTGMTKRFIKKQSYFQADVPDCISVPDAYSGTIGYAKSLGYDIEDYDNIEVYDEIFKDPAFYRFRLLIPIRE